MATSPASLYAKKGLLFTGDISVYERRINTAVAYYN
jgi:hypothetical protein